MCFTVGVDLGFMETRKGIPVYRKGGVAVSPQGQGSFQECLDLDKL